MLAGASLVLSSVAAAAVAARNADTIDGARTHGLDLARAATDFRTHLANADAAAAGTLIAGGLETDEQRAQYDTELFAASEALTAVGLAATDDDEDAVNTLSDGLIEYAGLVETGRANSRQGFPVGAAYIDAARGVANDQLAPQAEQLRREGEQRMARAANSVGGLLGGVAVVLLVLGIVVLVGCALVVAGRTRRFTHPALLLSGVAAIACLVWVTGGILAQGSELRRAATGDVSDFVDTNEAANALSDLRVTEIDAVAARGSGTAAYDQFAADADELLAEDIVNDGDRIGYRAAIEAYRSAVVGEGDSVRKLDLEDGDNRLAANSTLEGASKVAFDGRDEPTEDLPAVEGATDLAGASVAAAGNTLEERLDAASAANVNPLVPVLLGVLAAVLAVGGILARGRKYR